MSSTHEWLEILDEGIDYLVERFQGRKSKKSIINWLKNFEGDDCLIGFEILRRLTYITEDELKFECERLLKCVFDHYAQEDNIKIYIIPIGKYGKSSTLLTYYFSHTDIFKTLEKSEKILILSNENLVKETPYRDTDILLFIDDFFGTGGSIVKGITAFHDTCKGSAQIVSTRIASSIYWMAQAKETISNYDPYVKLIGREHSKIFGNSPLLFHSQSITDKYKEFCIKISASKTLYKIKNTYHNLGYKDSEALIVFPYAVPNNTLPIIWSDKNEWTPLWPRNDDAIFWQLRSYKDDLAYAAAKNILGFRKTDDLPSNIKTANFIILGLLRFLAQSGALSVFIREFSIKIDDLDVYLETARNRNFIDADNKLTPRGIIENEKYKKVLQKHRQERRRISLNPVPKYVPQRFSG